MFNISFELIMFVKMGNKKQNQNIALFIFLCEMCVTTYSAKDQPRGIIVKLVFTMILWEDSMSTLYLVLATVL